MSGLKTRINDDVKTAMRAQDKQRLGVLRMILAAIKQKEVDDRIELDDPQVLAVLDRMAKQHRDSIGQYGQAGRQDLVDKEQYELAVVTGYLPQALSTDELAGLVRDTISETGATSAKDMGRVMAALKPRVQGRCDMAQASRLVKDALG